MASDHKFNLGLTLTKPTVSRTMKWDMSEIIISS